MLCCGKSLRRTAASSGQPWHVCQCILRPSPPHTFGCLSQVLTAASLIDGYGTHPSHMLNSGCACELALSTNLGHGGRYDQFGVICFFTLKFTLATKRSARQCSNLDSGGLFLCVVASGLSIEVMHMDPATAGHVSWLIDLPCAVAIATHEP
jgi:hypothetical protein